MATNAEVSVVIENNVEKNILTCTGSDFFDLIETQMNTVIPVVIRNVLMLNNNDGALVLSRVKDSDFEMLQDFMRTEFCKDIIPDDAVIADYLGIYSKCQQKFVFSRGHKILIEAIVEYCGTFLFFQHHPSTSDKLVLDDNENTVNGAQEPTSKKAYFKSLFTTIYKWMRNRKCFDHVSTSDIGTNHKHISTSISILIDLQIRNQQIGFKVYKNTFERRADGTIVCYLKCPIKHFNCRFWVSLKTYPSPSYYHPKKQSTP